MRQSNDRRISQNPAGYLVQSIRDDYVPPAGVNVNRKAGPVLSDDLSKHACLAAKRARSRRPSGKTEMFHVETSRATEYLSAMPSRRREELEDCGDRPAHRVLAEGYQRALAAGKAEVAEQYRQVIVEQYLRETLQTEFGYTN